MNNKIHIWQSEKMPWFLLFAAILLSRLLTSVNYIEEPDSMRFALALTEFDIVKLQPHFPGYPVFVFISKIIFTLSGSMAVTFAFIGSIAIFLSIFSATYICKKLCHEAFFKRYKYGLWALLFFNPLLWVMSTSYMPDTLGCGITMLAIYFFIESISGSQKAAVFFQFTVAVLAGVRLSYLPMLFLPSVYLLLKGERKILQIISGLAGILLWLLPTIFITGFNELVQAASTHSEGHFNNWGGSAITENDYLNRFIMLFRGIWADGFGGWWPERSIITAITSLAIIFIIIAGITYVHPLKNTSGKSILKWLLICVFSYLVWIFLGQNIVYKARHVLPLIPLLVILIFIALEKIFISRKKLAFILFFSLLIPYSITGIIIATQHKKPTAIAKLQQYLNDDQFLNSTIISIPLVNDYLRAHGVKAQFIDSEIPAETTNFIESKNNIIYIGHQIPGIKKAALHEEHFYHNPYVNRMWPHIAAYKY